MGDLKKNCHNKIVQKNSKRMFLKKVHHIIHNKEKSLSYLSIDGGVQNYDKPKSVLFYFGNKIRKAREIDGVHSEVQLTIHHVYVPILNVLQDEYIYGRGKK